MTVECVLFGPLREAVGEKTVEREAPTVGALLRGLEADYPGLAGRLVTEEDTLPEDIAVTLNTKHVQYLDGLATELEAGDVVRLTPAIHGG